MRKNLAIIGSGQLAQMMAQEGRRMGLQFSFLAEQKEDTVCVQGLGTLVRRSPDTSAQELYEQLGQPDGITVEKEHVDIELLQQLSSFCPVLPNVKALEIFKNRHTEKVFLQELKIPLADFRQVNSEASFNQAVDSLTHPVFVKSEEEGYDGYNQFRVDAHNRNEVCSKLNFPNSWVAESSIKFDREVSFIAVRSETGEIQFYPAVENYHHQGTLLRSLAPAPSMSQSMMDTGYRYLQKIVEYVDYVGVICMECFVCGEELLVNEIAPRVHNSGHWTTKGAHTSQFENHIRAVAGLPLGSTKLHGSSGMLNLLGVVLEPSHCDKDSFLTLYGKNVRPRRKLGHVTVLGDDIDALNKKLLALQKIAYDE